MPLLRSCSRYSGLFSAGNSFVISRASRIEGGTSSSKRYASLAVVASGWWGGMLRWARADLIISSCGWVAAGWHGSVECGRGDVAGGWVDARYRGRHGGAQGRGPGCSWVQGSRECRHNNGGSCSQRQQPAAAPPRAHLCLRGRRACAGNHAQHRLPRRHVVGLHLTGLLRLQLPLAALQEGGWGWGETLRCRSDKAQCRDSTGAAQGQHMGSTGSAARQAPTSRCQLLPATTPFPPRPSAYQSSTHPPSISHQQTHHPPGSQTPPPAAC